jgi:Leucine-rich repeat (LRR) protein
MRLLCCLLLVWSVLLSGCGESKRERSQSEEDAVEAIRKLGGEAWSPGHRIGEPIFSVKMGGTKVTDAELVYLKEMKSLQLLNLYDTKVTDAGLAHLKGLKSLQYLFLANTDVTDAGLMHLKEMKSLFWLDVSGTKVTDAGLIHLKGLAVLQFLHLSNTHVTTAGMKELQSALPKCKITK